MHETVQFQAEKQTSYETNLILKLLLLSEFDRLPIIGCDNV